MLKRVLLSLATLLVVLYAVALGVLYFKQRDFQYEPIGKVWSLTDTALSGVEAVAIPTIDSSVVNGWFKASAPGKPTILFYKGNSKSFGEEHERFERWTSEGYGFLAFDYRGFPASPGEISQETILNDALSAFDWLSARSPDIVIWGRSLGSGPATYVASQRDARALVLETPYTSTVDVAAERYWYMPVGLLMHDQFPLKQWILDVDEPVFVGHGTEDQTIAVHHGQAVYALAPTPGALWIEPGVGHSDLWKAGIWGRVDAFLAQLAP